MASTGRELGGERPEALGECDACVRRGVGEEHEELVAADPRDHIARAQPRAEQRRERCDDRVAELVTDPVVECKHSVDVDRGAS